MKRICATLFFTCFPFIGLAIENQPGQACNLNGIDVQCVYGAICVKNDRYEDYVCQWDCATNVEESWEGTGHFFQVRVCYETSRYDMIEQYRCAAGFYGEIETPDTLCPSCPLDGMSLNGTTDITGCFLPKGSTRSDETGTFTVDDVCYY